MREIKFRAWNYEEKEMYYADDFQPLVYGCETRWVVKNNARTDKGDVLVGADNGELMQYTGLKDKNGVEICEGDIVRGMRGIMGVCKFEHGRFFIGYGDSTRLTFIYENRNKIKILGNIYENPELLEKQ